MSSCCELLGISPQAYYKRLRRAQRLALRDEMVLRHVMAIRREMPLLGGRKLQHMLLSALPGEFRLGRMPCSASWTGMACSFAHGASGVP